MKYGNLSNDRRLVFPSDYQMKIWNEATVKFDPSKLSEYKKTSEANRTDAFITMLHNKKMWDYYKSVGATIKNSFNKIWTKLDSLKKTACLSGGHYTLKSGKEWKDAYCEFLTILHDENQQILHDRRLSEKEKDLKKENPNIDHNVASPVHSTKNNGKS